MLQEIGNSGLYLMAQPVFMSRPSVLLPNDLDLRPLFDEASDELVRRLLEFSNQRNEWVGVGWTAVVKRQEAELIRYQEVVTQYGPKQARHLQALQNYKARNKWTRGLYGLVQPEPLPPANLELTDLEKRVIWCTRENRQRLGLAAMKLKEDDYLSLEMDKPDNEKGNAVFFVRPKLVLRYLGIEKA